MSFFILKKKSIFFKNLSRMLHSGIGIAEALQESRNLAPHEVISLLKRATEDNNYNILLQNKKWFSPMDIQFLKVAHETGNWPEILETLSEIAIRKYRQTANFISKLIYPFLLLNAAIIIPNISIIYTAQNGVSQFIKTIAPPLIILYIILFLSIIFKNILIKVVSIIPGISGVVKSYTYANLLYLIGTMLKSGITILTTISLIENAEEDPFLEKKLAVVKKSLENGNQFHVAVREANLFPPEIISIIKSAEISGKLEESILHEAKLMLEEAEGKMNFTLKVIATLFYLAVVGFIAYKIIGTVSSSVKSINKALDF